MSWFGLFTRHRKPGGWDADGRAYRRRDSRQMTLVIDDEEIVPVDWSLGGFRLRATPQRYPRGTHLHGQVKGGPDWPKGAFVAQVVWAKDDGAIGLRIIEITPEVFLAMADLKSC
ncbi:MAG: PilZ domain-containing protein [Alphaproteobacteria bacterium]